MNTIQQIQRVLAVKPDGIWGPKSQGALIEATAKPDLIMLVQKLIGVKQDGKWGLKSQARLNVFASPSDAMNVSFQCQASSFADPADLRAFKRCKATGKSDIACFAEGDNGIGQFGKVTAQETLRMVAVHKRDMVARWGSVGAAAHRRVMVTVNGKTIDATVEDRISAPGRIDLNPACAKALGLKPPFVVPCEWRWL